MPTLEERVTIARPMDEVYQMLSHDDAEWLQPFVRIAAHKGEKAGGDLRARLQAHVEEQVDQPRVVTITVGEPSMLVEGAAIEVPIHLELTGYSNVFSAFHGRLLVSEAEPNRTMVTLGGTFQPPTSMTGALDDTLVAQHAAQTAMRDLIDNLRIAMEDESLKGLVEDSG